MNVLLPPALAAAILAEAKAASPRECCGLAEGTRRGDTVVVEALHPVRNLAEASDRFAMDPTDQFTAQRRARANGRAILGCYHSHPGGAAQPSTTDLAGAHEEDFVWLIAGTGEVNAFVYREGEFVGLVTGADWVTSSL